MTTSCQKQLWHYGLVWLYLSLCSMLFWHCEQPGVVVQVDKDDFSIEDQVVIGQAMKAELLKMPDTYPLLDKARHECAYKRIETLYKTLQNTSIVKNRRTFNWDVHIIDDDAIKNAFILPGGHLFVYSGLMKYLETESELVAVLGHEIAHADHGLTLNALRAEHGNVTISSLCSGSAAPELATIVKSLPYLKHDEAAVFDADAVSVSLICPFQYDANSLKRFVKKANLEQIEWIQSKGGNLNKRMKYINELAASCGVDESTFEERYANYKNRCLQ